MPPRTDLPDRPSDMIEAIACAYLEAASDDAATAIRAVIADALTDLSETEHGTLRLRRLISHGYVRGRLDRERL